jgi:hypothetical protein
MHFSGWFSIRVLKSESGSLSNRPRSFATAKRLKEPDGKNPKFAHRMLWNFDRTDVRFALILLQRQP